LLKGEQLTVAATVSGTGPFTIGLYQYGDKAKWQWRGQVASWRHASKYPQKVKITLSPTKPDVRNVCIFLASNKGATVKFADLTITKQENQKDSTK
jgi:hypothetical protein